MKRFHRKTRNGCTQCRKRRVKCDETKPYCRNCSRNSLQCSLRFLIPKKPEDQLDSHRVRSGSVQILGATSAPGVTICLTSSPLDLKSMELFHHYTSVTCLTVGPCRHMHIWQTEIPRLALSHEFLMQGLLALSAAHLAHLRPNRSSELRRRAALAEQEALPAFREFSATPRLENINAVFAFAGFIPPYLLAQSGWLDAPTGRIPSSHDDRPHWFHTVRGLTRMLARSWSEIAQGPFRATLARAQVPIDLSRNPDDYHLLRLYALLEPSASLTLTEIQNIAVCRTALDELRRVAALPFSPCKTLGSTAAVFIWPGSVSEAFVDLMHRRIPEALVILAHYCVLLKNNDSIWYLHGVGDAMLTTIDEELGNAWRPWISWALVYRVHARGANNTESQ